MRHSFRLTEALFGAALLLTLGRIAAADNWPAWRGPDMTGQCKERNLPLKWSAEENVRWKAPLPGPGMSSPIVWGDRIFLTQSLDKEGSQRALLCFDRKDGRQLWQHVIQYAEKESTYPGEPHYCSASPVTDGERVVASFGSAGIICCDFQGKELWRRDLGKCEQIWGNASSPILYRDLVLLNFGPGERTFLIALDKRSGRDAWKVEEPGGKYGTAPSEWIGSWSTPVVLRIQDHDELIMTWPENVKAYNPRTGALLWTCAGLTRLVYTSPLVTPEVIVAMSGFGGSYLAVKPGGRGDVTATNRLWHVDRSTQRIGSGVIVGDHVYILNASGTAECIELKTGKTLWTERAGGSAWGSMVHADGRLYVTTQQGETLVLAAKPAFEIISRTPLSERSQSSPAFSNGEIFIRTYEHLWCISTK
jgi:outer membrane protein assembly factor BamB